jgi:hypothetical protein
MSDAPPDPQDPENPRREFRFKPPEFEPDNRPAELHGSNAPIDVSQHYRLASRPAPAPGTAVKAENEVHAILRANVARAEAKGLNQVVPGRRRPSRRKRDYWTMLAGGNLLVGGVMLAAHNSIPMLVLGLSGAVLFSVGLTWMMWFVMDDY